MVRQNFKEIQDLTTLRKIMAAHNVTKLYVKKLSPNDNSKNQPYLGGNFEALNIIPNHGVMVDDEQKGSKRDRFKALIDLYWVTGDAQLCPAPNAQLILYPKYPEVRMSGFLKGCDFAPSEMMSSRLPGRLMFLGMTDSGKIIGHVTSPENPVGRELDKMQGLEPAGVFLKVPLDRSESDPRGKLIAALRDVHLAGWINSVKLGPNGILVPYKASNGGGYTLEACLGITPNGYSEPDYLGWEVKQHGVDDLSKPHSGSPITLFTPEPTAGIYKEKGVEYFIRKFGYADKRGREDRFNFGGIYRCGTMVASTGLTLNLIGYNSENGKIEDVGGGITLFNAEGEAAATWLYADLMKHWNRKHAQAAYVPSLSHAEPQQQYHYGNIIELGHGTDFLKFLKAVSKGIIYYDPGIKLENASTAKPITKRRSQFRIKPKELSVLYHQMELVDVNE
jgi:hypothetical protein